MADEKNHTEEKTDTETETPYENTLGSSIELMREYSRQLNGETEEHSNKR